MKPKIVQGNCGKVSIVTRDGAESVKTNHNLKERNIKCFAWRDDITEVIFHPAFPEMALKFKDGSIKKYKYELLDPQPV
jgi:hypothetical protein